MARPEQRDALMELLRGTYNVCCIVQYWPLNRAALFEVSMVRSSRAIAYMYNPCISDTTPCHNWQLNCAELFEVYHYGKEHHGYVTLAKRYLLWYCIRLLIIWSLISPNAQCTSPT